MRCVIQRLVFEFEDYTVSKLIYVLKIVDDMDVSIITNVLKNFVEKNNSLREKTLYLISFRKFIENADEVAVEHSFFDHKSRVSNLISELFNG